MTRCVMVDGALVRVSRDFDEREDSDDMKALREVLAAMRDRIENPTEADRLGIARPR